MSSYSFTMLGHPRPHVCDVCAYLAPLPTGTLGPVADTAEPVAAEAGRPIPEPDGDDGHTVTHG